MAKTNRLTDTGEAEVGSQVGSLGVEDLEVGSSDLVESSDLPSGFPVSDRISPVRPGSNLA